MSTTASAEAIVTPPAPLSLFDRVFLHVENAALILCLAATVLLPLAEMICRKLAIVGLQGSMSFVQHATLVLGVLGGAVAARQNRLLAMATTQFLPHGWPTVAARVISGAVSAAVAAMLALAATQFLREEYEVGKLIAYGIPAWIFELALPLGFALIALRVLWHSADRWPLRFVTAAVAAALLAPFLWLPIPPGQLVIPALVLLLLATLLGGAIFAVLGGAALILFFAQESPITSLSLDHYRLVINPTLPTIPLFTLAGYFLAEGGASRRLVRVFHAIFGPIPGGPAIVTVLVCAFFTSFTGASGVTILALGGLLMPILVSSGFSDRNALGLLTGAGALGMLFPPCLPLILYAIIAKMPIEAIFLAALLPGVLLVIMSAILGLLMSPRSAASRPRFSLTEARKALWEAKWELLLPVVCLIALFSGVATPVEAAAVTAFYAFLTQTVIWRDLRIIRDVPRVMIECVIVIGGVMLILGVAQGFTNYLIDIQLPDMAVEWTTRTIQSPLLFLLLLNVLLLIVGCLMDVYSAIVVVAPLLVPIGEAFGVAPLHLGVIFLANLELGFLTPPIGVNLFLSSYRFNKPVSEVCISIIPILLVQLAGVLLITYLPHLTTALPRWFGY